MSADLRLPNITATTEAGKLLQVQSYLFQLVGELNYALGTIEAGMGGNAPYAVEKTGGSGGELSPDDAAATFNSLKGLIIKSADIVNAYYEAINSRLEGQYVAQSEFGTYVEETAQALAVTSTRIEQQYSDIQQMITDIDGLEHSLIEATAYINSGLLYYDDNGTPVYGLEVGQRTEIDGAEVFNKYAQFTSDRLAFFDQNGNEVAYISDKKLYITHVEVRGTFRIGGFVDTVLANKSVVTRWVEAEV